MKRAFFATFCALTFAACSAGREGTIPSGASAIGAGAAAGISNDASGNVYVANWYNSSVAVYSAGGARKLRTITDGIANPNALGVDKGGTLFVGNFGKPSGSLTSNVTVYSPSGSSPLRTIVQGILGPFAIAFNSSSKVYVANNGAPSVTV
ncbi:MAG TPA: hypothetical protein VKE42_04840, partial [Candidatus Cybelea sp.]|nr:hypothetical protein [Candidatus Cybelea sp.]